MPSIGSVDLTAAVARFYGRRRVLVVGADGFLGYNFVRLLRGLDANVSILTRSYPSRSQTFAENTFRGDLLDEDLVREAVLGQELIFDLAGSLGAMASNQFPQTSLEHDCKGHLTLLLACVRADHPPPVLFASSRLVYGQTRYTPVDEDHPIAPQSIYAVHKLTVENYLRVLGASAGLRFCVFRLSNPYGPYQSESAKGYGVINRFLRAAACDEEIVIFGDGQQIRDYIHVADVGAAFLTAAAQNNCWGQIFNLGGRNPIRLAEAAQQIVRLAGSKGVRFQPWPKDYAAVETGDYCTDNSRVTASLNLPAPLPLVEGLEQSLRFYREEYRTCRAAAASNASAGMERP